MTIFRLQTQIVGISRKNDKKENQKKKKKVNTRNQEESKELDTWRRYRLNKTITMGVEQATGA